MPLTTISSVADSDESLHEILDPVNPDSIFVDIGLNSFLDLDQFYISRDLEAMECNSVPSKKKPKVFEVLNIDGKPFFHIFELIARSRRGSKIPSPSDKSFSVTMCNPEGQIILQFEKSRKKRHGTVEVRVRKPAQQGAVGAVKMFRSSGKCRGIKYEFELQDPYQNKLLWIPSSRSHDVEYELLSEKNGGVSELSGKIFVSVRNAFTKEQVWDYALVFYKEVSIEVKALSVGAVILMDRVFSKARKIM